MISPLGEGWGEGKNLSMYPRFKSYKINLNEYKFDMPLMFRVGVSVDFLKEVGNSNLNLAVAALHPNDDVESLNLGGK